jgi:hypothetical protein
MLIAELTVRPVERMFSGPKGSASLEPLVMALFLNLAARAGSLVTRRELFQCLWGSLSVGDDNLNRLVAALRRVLNQIGVTSVGIHTVPSTGYVLLLQGPASPAAADRDVEQALGEARDSWRMSLPQPDHLRIALLTRAAEVRPGDPRLFGALALLHRHAAEYAPPRDASEHVSLCENAARRALELDADQVEARTALISVTPLYGRWLEASRQLGRLCTQFPGHPVCENDLAVVEMATGQIAAAMRRRDAMIVADPLAAMSGYKAVYQHWSSGDLVGMDHMADRAMQLWPFHPAVWAARFWTLAFTSRLAAAKAMLAPPLPSAIPSPLSAFLRQTIAAAGDGDEQARQATAQDALTLAGQGPALAVAALLALGLLGSTDDAFAVARRYYLQDGEGPVPLGTPAGGPQLNEQHRRLTQVLFTPACAAMRDDPRFDELCRATGLTAFWDESGVRPDFMLLSGTRSATVAGAERAPAPAALPPEVRAAVGATRSAAPRGDGRRCTTVRRRRSVRT